MLVYVGVPHGASAGRGGTGGRVRGRGVSASTTAGGPPESRASSSASWRAGTGPSGLGAADADAITRAAPHNAFPPNLASRGGAGGRGRGGGGFYSRLLNEGIAEDVDFTEFTARGLVRHIEAQPEPNEVLFRLDGVGRAADVTSRLLKTMLSEGDSSDFRRDVVLPFLRWLSQPKLDRGTCKRSRDKVILVVAAATGLVESLVEALKAAVCETTRIPSNTQPLTQEDQHVVAWFLSSCLTIVHARDRVDDRTSSSTGGGPSPQQLPFFNDREAVLQLASVMERPEASNVLRHTAQGMRRLCASDEQSSASRSHLQLQGTVTSLKEMEALLPGGRHDNDKEDFREVCIVPTAEEITCHRPPFLPTLRDVWPVLDRLFRLLREDMVRSFRELSQAAAVSVGHAGPSADGRSQAKTQPVRSKSQPRGKRRPFVYEQVQLMGLRRRARNSSVPGNMFVVSFCVPRQHPAFPRAITSAAGQSVDSTSAASVDAAVAAGKEQQKEVARRKDCWDTGRASRHLSEASMVYIAEQSALDRPLLVAQVVWRDADALACDPPSIGLHFSNGDTVRHALEMMAQQRHPREAPLELSMVAIPVALFAFEPVLRRLQTIAVLPFEREITGDTALSASPPPAPTITHPMSSPSPPPAPSPSPSPSPAPTPTPIPALLGASLPSSLIAPTIAHHISSPSP